MTEYELKVPSQLLSSLMNDKNALAELLEEILSQVLQVQVEDQLGAGHYERSAERTGYRNGYRPRALYTRAGPLTLRVPFNERPLGPFPFVLLDAMYLEARDRDAETSKAALMVSGCQCRSNTPHFCRSKNPQLRDSAAQLSSAEDSAMVAVSSSQRRRDRDSERGAICDS